MADEFNPYFVNFRQQKPTRARTEEKKHGDLLKALTLNLVETYAGCSSGFGYSLTYAPRRVLTKLSKGVHNGGNDNAENDYICRVGDKIVNPEGHTYEILERLGHGTFGQVLKCHPSFGNHQSVALKIIKNKPAYFQQALVEIRIVKMLNEDFDPSDNKRIVRMLDYFVYRKHLCIAFELLSVNLYDVLKQNSFRGVSILLIRVLTEQLLKAMRCLREALVIHCDLKPENVLLSDMHHTGTKLIDFGSACFENHIVYSYIQSRFYRSPEVLLGLPYTSAIDMWSLGCICAELYLGLPIFPGQSEYDQICRIVDVLGLPSSRMLDHGKNTSKYFRRVEEPQEVRSCDGASGSGDNASEDSMGKSNGAIPPCAWPADEEPGPLDRGGDERDSPSCGQRVGPLPAGQHEEDDPFQEDAEAKVEPPPPIQPASSPSTNETSNDSSIQPRKIRRSRSFLSCWKKQESSDEGPLNVPPQPLGENSNSGSTQGSRGPHHGGIRSLGEIRKPSGDGSGANESCHSAGSTMSTAAETTSELPASGRWAQGPDELGHQDGSSDGQGEPRRNTVANGKLTQKGWTSNTAAPTMDCQQPRRSRGRRRGTQTSWRLKTREEYERDEHKKEPIPKKYYDFRSLEQMVGLVPYKQNLSARQIKEEQERRMCFLQFLFGVLQTNPDLRWTPKQAAKHSFITGAAYNPDFQPVYDEPVPSFTQASQPAKPCVGAFTGSGEVPRLPVDAMGPFVPGVCSGAGSARTWHENTVRQGNIGGGMDAEQTRSAPATTRGRGGTGRVAAPLVWSGTGSAGKNDVESSKREPEPAVDGPHHFNRGIPLPDDNPAESYRPPIEKLSEDFFRNIAQSRWGTSTEQVGQNTSTPQKIHKDTCSVSTGASLCSSASSTGSTPPGGRGRRGNLSPYSVGSPHSAGGGPLKGHLGHAPTSKSTGFIANRHQLSCTTATPASSPQGSVASGTTYTVQMAASSSGGNAMPAQTPHRNAGPPTGITIHNRAVGSRDGSRQSSPWHLPSPVSELSYTSERMTSSQPSNSDSCGEFRENPLPQYQGAQCNFDECAFDDPSQSDTPHLTRSTQLSDSDCTTPRSHDAAEHTRTAEGRSNAKDPQKELWENITNEIERFSISRERGCRQLNLTQSPGRTGAGNFREAVGMNESGPVIPRGLQKFHHDAPHGE